jgi:hypothetical protein
LINTAHLIIELMVLLLLVFAFSIRYASVQTRLANYIVSVVLQDCPSELSIKQVDTDFFHHFRLKEVVLKDHNNNVLIESESAWLGFPSLLALSKGVVFEDLILENGSLNIIKYQGDTIDNLTHFIRCFPKSESETTTELELKFLKLQGINFTYVDENKTDVISSGLLNINDIFISNLNLDLENILFKENAFSARLSGLTFSEKSGFNVKDLIAKDVFFSDSLIGFNNVRLTTGSTNLRLNSLVFNYNSIVDFNDFINLIDIDAEFITSKIHLNDLKYFYTPFQNFSENFTMNGLVSGTISDLYSDNLYIEKNSNTEIVRFKGKAHVTGLPDAGNTFYDIVADDLQLNKLGIERLELLKLGNVSLKLPDNISKLGTIKGKGMFRGYIQGFMSEFDFNTNLGRLNTDLNFYYDDYSKQLNYDGNLVAQSFHLGKLSGNKDLGQVSGNVNINATGKNFEELKTTIKGKVKSIYFNKYTYKNIALDGVFEKNHFDGYAQINDPNLVATYDGNIDFKQKVPAYSFCLSLLKANLYPLYFLEIPDAYLSLNVDVNGSGFDFDNLNGDFKFSEIHFIENNKTYLADSLILASKLSENYNSIQIWSSILDASMEGKYNLKEMPLILKEMASRVLPKKFYGAEYQIEKNQNLRFNFDLKNISAITDLLVPNLELSQNSTIKGSFNSNAEYFEITSNIDYIKYAGVTYNGIKLETQLSEIFEVEIDIDSVSHLENTVGNITLFGAVFNDNIGLKVQWKDKISEGKLGGNGYWDDESRFKFDLHQTEIATKQQHWKLNETATLTQIDSTKYHFDQFRFSNKNQVFTVQGDLGRDYSDLFTIRLDSVKLSDVIPIKSFQLGGKIDALIQVRSALKTPMILGRLTSDVIVDNSNFGKLDLQAWMKGKDSINVHGDLIKNNMKELEIDGYYLNRNDSPLNLNVAFNNFNLQSLNIFLPTAISDLKGNLNGAITLRGTAVEPDFEGNLKIRKGNVKIGALNTQYAFEGDVEVTPDLIYATNAKAFDTFGNRADILSASYYHTYFKEFSYDFNVRMTQPFLALNTTYEDNNLFYGRAFATGYANISYDRYNFLEINVDATAHKNTEITLPLYGAEEVTIGDFITFVKFDDTTQVQQPEVNLSGISMYLNFTVTPDARINMVFDELVGDEIVAYGSGNIYMEIDQYDQFKMYGQYELERGEYLFTLKDIINKKFELKKGGTVGWYGDPYNAEIDISAVYNVRTSVAELFPEEEQQKYTAKQDVECEMVLSNTLFSPNINFGINLPRSSDQIRSMVGSTISTKEELERQFFSLLLLNRFLPRQSSSLGSVGTGVGSSTSELLTSQVNQILDKWINSNLGVGINYLTGDNLSNEEYAVALSTQLFSDKLLLSGNFGVSQNRGNPENSTVIGDVMVEYIIDSLGIWRVKAFNQSNAYDPTRAYQGDYTQGVGLSYQKSFNHLNELKILNMVSRFFNRKEDND